MSAGAAHHSGSIDVPATLKHALLRVLTSDGDTVGLAFLVSPTVAITCAHVVSGALTSGGSHPPGPGAEVVVERVFPGEEQDTDEPVAFQAVVRHWSWTERGVPHGPGDDVAPLDVAVLDLAVSGAEGRGPGGRLPLDSGAEEITGHAVRAFGLPAGRPAGVWHAGRLAGHVASGWIQVDKGGPAGYRVSRGFSGTPVWDEALGRVVGMVTVADVGDVPAAFAIPMGQILDGVPGLRAELLPPSPFPGLRPFTGEHGYSLLGRDREAADLVTLLDERRHVGVVGSSGSGKSSLLRAGIGPRLRQQGDTVVVLRPSDAVTPLDALALSLAPLIGEAPGVLGARIAREGLAPVIARTGPGARGRRLVVVVDQLEEVFGRPPEQVDALADALLGDHVPPTVRTVAALRSDFLGQALAHPRLRSLVQAANLYTVAPLDDDGLRTVLLRPDAAGRPTVALEENLADRILAEARGSAAPLPLLSHALDQMWRHGAGQLTHRAYDAVGGVAGAFEAVTARWLDDVPTGGEAGLTRLFAQLVAISGSTALPTRRALRISDVPETLRPLVQGLTTAGILTATDDPEGETLVELAHDALFTAWRPLRELIDRDREFLIWSDLLQHDADRWAESDRATHRLPRAAELEVAAAWESTRGDHLGPRQREYLAAGRAQERRRKRRRRVLGGLVVLSGAVVLAVVAATLSAMAENADRQRTASSLSLAGAASATMEADPALAILTAVAAYRTEPTQEARDQLLNLYLRYGERARVLSGMPGGLKGPGTVHSEDGEVVLASTWMEHAFLAVDVMSGPVRQRELPVSRVQSVALSADGRRAVYVQSDGGLGWFEVRPDEPDLMGPVHELESWTATVPEPPDADERYNGWPHSIGPSMSRDGRMVAMRVWDRFVWWDLESGRIAGDVAAPYDTLWDMWVGPEGDELLVPLVVDDESLEQDLVAIDLADGSHRVVARGGSAYLLSGDRKTAVRCQAGQEFGAVTRFRVADGQQLDEPFGYRIEDGGSCDWWTVGLSGGRAGATSTDTKALVDLEGVEVESQYAAIIDSFDVTDHELFVERPDGLFVLTTGEADISYLAVPEAGDTSERIEEQILMPDGRSAIVRQESYEDDEPLQVRKGDVVVAEADSPEAGWDEESSDRLRTSPDGSLVAIREGRGVVALRDARTLQLRTTIHPQLPEVRSDSIRAELVAGWPAPFSEREHWVQTWLTVDFDSAGNLLTLSDGEVQYWDVTTGREIASLDAQSLRGVGKDVPVVAGPHWQPGKVAITEPGKPGTLVVDVRTGAVVGEVPTGDDILGVRFDPTGRYVATYGLGGTIEVWEASSFERVLGPLRGIGQPNGWLASDAPFVAEFLGDGRFLVGDDDAVSIYTLGERGYPEKYRLDVPQGGVLSAVAAGPTVVVRSARGDSMPGTTRTVRLDPETWVETLCGVVAHRSFTPVELAALPTELAVPADVCLEEPR